MKTLLLATALAVVMPVTARADITIGVSTSSTGPAASLGIPEKNAFGVLGPTIGGVPVRYIVLDDGAQPVNASKNARRFITEDNVDAIVGSSTFPSSLAMAEVANEGKVPLLTLAPGLPPPARRAWVFSVPQSPGVMNAALVEHMVASKIRTVAFIGYSDSLGSSYHAALAALLEPTGIRLVADERYERTDASVNAQMLRILAAKPDAIFVAASGTPAALPQLAMAERDVRLPVYQTPGAVNRDFLRVGGKAVEGSIGVTGLTAVAEQLPSEHPSRAVTLSFKQRYEAKFGAESHSPFASYAYDAYLLLERAVEVAKRKARPGTPAFREALRDALQDGTQVVGTHGTYRYLPDEHANLEPGSRALVVVNGGAWRLLPAPAKRP